jgi:hypothetical protein
VDDEAAFGDERVEALDLAERCIDGGQRGLDGPGEMVGSRRRRHPARRAYEERVFQP